MGYSGGFMPFIEAVSKNLVYNVKTIVGVGGPSVFISKPEIFGIMVSILEFVLDGLLEGAGVLLKTLGYDDPFVDNFIMAAQISNEMLYPYIKDIITKFSATFPYSPSRTDLIVNVWGSKDIFHQLGVVDKRENFLGKTTYNIEIEGATHFDYMRREGVDENSTNPEDVKNFKIASFVTDLIIASENKDTLDVFIAKKRIEEIMSQDERGVYVVSSKIWST